MMDDSHHRALARELRDAHQVWQHDGHYPEGSGVLFKRAAEEIERLAGLVISEPRAEMQPRGWMVGVHNDYRLDGEWMTFWLFTDQNGRYVKGEGRTDAEAIAQAYAALPRED